MGSNTNERFCCQCSLVNYQGKTQIIFLFSRTHSTKLFGSFITRVIFPQKKSSFSCLKMQKNTHTKKHTKKQLDAKSFELVLGGLTVQLIHANIHSFLCECCCMFLGNLLQDELVAQYIHKDSKILVSVVNFTDSV